MNVATVPDKRNIENEWRYIWVLLGAFIFTPEVRRLLDWHGSFSSIDIVSPLPLLMMLPVAWNAFKHRKLIAPTPFVWILLGWSIAFGYGLLVGIAQGVALASIYGVAVFVLPVAVGGWTLTLSMSTHEIFTRMTRILFVYGGIAGVYGIVQFIVAPPWDTAWMINIDAHSFGSPTPFGIRVFSVLNGPGVFASFLAAVLIISVSTLDLRKPLQLIATCSMIVSLVLTLVRTSWLEVGLGILVLAIVHPSRIKSISSISLLAVLSVVAIAGFLTFSPDETFRDTLQQRFSTFGQLSEDGSALDRQEAAQGALRASFDNPQGVGLAVSGVGAKLASPEVLAFAYNPDPAIDNGYLSRLYELGFFGFAAFIATLVTSMVVAISAYIRARASGNHEDVAVVAISIAFQAGTIGTLYGGDVIQGLGGVLFFVIAALPVVVLQHMRATPSRFAAGEPVFTRPRDVRVEAASQL